MKRDRQRQVNHIAEKPTILIVCEGEQTEPNYFRGFRVSSATIQIHGTGMNTVSLVEFAIQKMQHTKYDRVWCVFDRDSFPANDFNDAISLARKSGINTAYSNEAFELWFLLHFDYCDSGLSRTQYGEKLTEKLGHRYAKNAPDMYSKLLSRQSIALTHAQNLISKYEQHNPAVDNPCTTVHDLVIELNNYR